MNRLQGIVRDSAKEASALPASVPQSLVASLLAEFEYTKLKTDRRWIRLLRIENSRRSSIIQCSLNEVCLDENPDFDALSYTWQKIVFKRGWAYPLNRPRFGAKKGSRMILCNGHIMRIQINLHDFMLRFRKQEGDGDDLNRYIWIDAICINQNDYKEKISQINMMESIYGSARTVFVWLGETTWTTKQGLRFMKDLRPIEITAVDFRFRDHILNKLEKHPTDAINLAIGKSSFEEMPFLGIFGAMGLGIMLAQEYFQRSWVVQELVLARQLRFFFGSTEISQNQLRNCIEFMLSAKTAPTAFSGFLNRGFFSYRKGFELIPYILKAQKDYQDGKVWSLEDCLSMCRDRCVTEPKDKIFAILGLVDGKVRQQLLDRTLGRSVQELYVHCSKILAKQFGWPRVLSLVGKTEEGCKHLPSWVPDYSVSHKPRPFRDLGCPEFGAALSVPPRFEVLENVQLKSWVLNLSAAHFDTISRVGESYDAFALSGISDIQGHMLNLIAEVGKRYRPTSEVTMDVFSRTLTANIFSNSGVDHQEIADGFVGWLNDKFFSIEDSLSKKTFFRTMYRFINLGVEDMIGGKLHDSRFDDSRQSLSAAIDEFVMIHDSESYMIRFESGRAKQPSKIRKHNGHNKFKVAFESIYRDRRLFLTERGYLGIGPSNLEEGDKVMLVASADIPFIFRYAENGNRRIKLIGSSYVHGIMHGEALNFQDLRFDMWSVV